MEKIRKQTVSRIAEFFNGESNNAEVDTYKKLLDFEKEVKKQFSLQGVSQRFSTRSFIIGIGCGMTLGLMLAIIIINVC
tara:strand:- start:20900 stop:21136 length:237 start_codon:yes stop_codon:yes gene_type:complete